MTTINCDACDRRMTGQGTAVLELCGGTWDKRTVARIDLCPQCIDLLREKSLKELIQHFVWDSAVGALPVEKQ